MQNPKPPLGQRFSHVYLRETELLQDSVRARRRLAAWLSGNRDTDGLEGFLVAELGVDVSWAFGSVNWPKTLENYTIVDFLDSITLTYRYFAQKRSRPMYDPNSHQRFIEICGRIFEEQNLSYTVDDSGGVHFKVDAQFAANTNASVLSLGAPRYANARAEFEKGLTAISSVIPDGKEGIRGVFGAAESIYRLMFPKAAKLTAADGSKNLQAIIQAIYPGDVVAQRAANKMINSFADWIDACHNYRHEQGVEEPSQPPLDLAIEMISAGAGFVRLLIQYDQRM
jgi:hypothetical protein